MSPVFNLHMGRTQAVQQLREPATAQHACLDEVSLSLVRSCLCCQTACLN